MSIYRFYPNRIGALVLCLNLYAIASNGVLAKSYDADDPLLCINHINLSLDQTTCTATLTPEMLIIVEEDCADGYTIEIRNEQDSLVSTTFAIGDINQTFNYEICCGAICCWGTVTVESKIQPTFDGCQDLTISCTQIDVLPPATVSGGSSCLAPTYTINLTNETRTDVTACNSPYTNVVERTFEATDANGNTATCTQNILLERVDFTSLQYPVGTTTINCSDLESYITYELDGQVVPLPWVPADLSESNMGVPYVDGDAFTGSGTGSGTVVPLLPNTNIYNQSGPDAFLLSDSLPIPLEAQSLCNTFVTYTDLLYPQVDCSTKLVRTWEILEWACGTEISQTPGSHIIEIIDNVAPDFVCPANLTVNSDNDCGNEVIIPGIAATDACLNEVNVRAFTPLGEFEMAGDAAAGITVNLIHDDNVVTYEVSDNCGNVERCRTTITLQDGTQPVAICEQSTTIGMGSTGQTIVSSQTFDDGSWDECSAVTTCAVRMSDLLIYQSLPVDTTVSQVDYVLLSNYKAACPLGNIKATIIDGVEYLSEDDLCQPYVQFCCMDMGTEQMVVFRAMDAGGNASDCMTSVEVQGFTPQLDCPDDITVDCGTDIATLNSGDVSITGDCQDVGTMIFTFSNANLNSCGLGHVVKTFSLQTAIEVLASCTQKIYVENQSVVNANIDWPTDTFDLTGICSVAQLSPTALNSTPTILNSGSCSRLGYDYDDVVDESNGCLAISRKWTAIDWCSRDANGTFRTYDYVQEITTIGGDTIEVTAPPLQKFQTASLDCERSITISATASQGCSDRLSWTYSLVDTVANQVVAIGNENTYTGVLPVSGYKMTWTASDGCNVNGTFLQRVVIESSKAPVATCKTTYSETIGIGETATIYPSNINGGSTHQCFDPAELILSFSEDGTQNTITHTCGVSMTQSVTLWVMLDPNDDRAQKSSCTSILTVDCGSPVQSNLVTVSGIVHTEDYQTVEEVAVDMGAIMGQEMTDVEGSYAFDPMPLGGSYQVIPQKDIDHLNGVSTLDLILIQRHMLSIETLDSPYKLIAADVNASNNIDGIDLIELRKLVLGIYDEFPENTSWRFFDESKEFVDRTNPWRGPLFESYSIPILQSDMELDFIGVKIGDVDNSFIAESASGNLDLRSHRWPLVLLMEDVELSKGDINSIAITAANYERISGFQGTLIFDEELIEILEIKSGAIQLTDTYTHLSDGAMTFSISDTEIKEYSQDDILFELVVKAKTPTSSSIFEVGSDITRAEAYRGFDEEVPLLLETKTLDTSKILSARPNPFIEYTNIEFNLQSAGDVTFEFYDTQGRLIYTESNYFSAGKGNLEVGGDDLGVNGVIYIKMVTDYSVNDFKMIKL